MCCSVCGSVALFREKVYRSCEAVNVLVEER